MLGVIISGLSKVGMWAGAVSGAHIISDTAKRYAEGSRYEPVVAGFGDTITTLLDPLDFSQTRARKEQKQREREQGLQESVKDEKRRVAAEKKAKEEQTKRARAAEKKLAEAQKKLVQSEQKAERLAREGRAVEARRAAESARSAARWQALAERTRQESEAKKNSDPEKSNALAAAALELAKMAINPPANAISAINAQATDAGKSLVASLVDNINRVQDPDIEALFQRMASGDVTAAAEYAIQSEFGDDSLDLSGEDHDHEVSGPGCCNSAKGKPQCNACKSGKSCPSKSAVPDYFVEGEGDYDNVPFSEFFSGVTCEDSLDTSVSGGDSYLSFMYGDDEGLRKRSGGCASGSCGLAASAMVAGADDYDGEE